MQRSRTFQSLVIIAGLMVILPAATATAAKPPHQTAVAKSSGASASLNWKWRAMRQTKRGYWNIEALYPVFQTPTPLTQRVNHEVNMLVYSEASEYMNRIHGRPQPNAPYGYQSRIVVDVASPRLVSLHLTETEFTPAGHVTTTPQTFTFGMKNNKPTLLRISDLFLPNVDPLEALSPVALPKIAKATGKTTLTALTPHLIARWVVTPTGFTFLMPPAEVGEQKGRSFALGITFDELDGKLAPNGPLKGIMADAKRTASDT